MGLSNEDVIEREVRRRLSEYLNSMGVDSGRVSIEILYMLPESFVQEYRELFDRALRWSPSGSGGGIVNEGRVTDEAEGRRKVKAQNAKARDRAKEEGKSRAEVAKAGGTKVRKDGRGNAKGGGKRYRDTQLVIADEVSLRIKELVDRRLKGMIGQIRANVIGAAQNGGDFVPSRSDTGKGNGGPAKDLCVTCGRGKGRGWVRCPYHN
jgi:hypothetical protein